jgi:CheY-like chemotaxis protein
MARILITDDEHAVRDMLRTALEREGHEVELAENGVEAIAKYRASPADLVLMDLVMPEKEGLETIRELKREFPDVRIIAISGGGRMGPGDYLSLAKHLGAMRVFAKPFDINELREAITEVLGTS